VLDAFSWPATLDQKPPHTCNKGLGCLTARFCDRASPSARVDWSCIPRGRSEGRLSGLDEEDCSCLREREEPVGRPLLSHSCLSLSCILAI
jgi:hypothetical protein